MAGAEQERPLERRIAESRWYHTIELPGGVETPGYFDTRPAARVVPMPPSLAGKRCLDVGTYDGFWAFEMERRGAREVMAVDVLDPQRWDWPAGSRPDVRAELGDAFRESQGFEVAREALSSMVERRDVSAYELDRDALGGFDFVYMGSLLLHLRDPVGALERVREVCDGEIVVEDAIEPRFTLTGRRTPVARLDALGRPWWWKANPAGLVRMVEAAGFEVTDGPHRFWIRFGKGGPRRRAPSPRALLGPGALEAALVGLRGADPHAALRARPTL